MSCKLLSKKESIAQAFVSQYFKILCQNVGKRGLGKIGDVKNEERDLLVNYFKSHICL